jgi:hypothetical protein
MLSQGGGVGGQGGQEMDAGGPPNKKPKIGAQTSLVMNGSGLATQMSESAGQ